MTKKEINNIYCSDIMQGEGWLEILDPEQRGKNIGQAMRDFGEKFEEIKTPNFNIGEKYFASGIWSVCVTIYEIIDIDKETIKFKFYSDSLYGSFINLKKDTLQEFQHTLNVTKCVKINEQEFNKLISISYRLDETKNALYKEYQEYLRLKEKFES